MAKDCVVQFGKYKGKLASWVVENDYPYALWLIKNSNSNTRTKRTVASIVDSRNYKRRLDRIEQLEAQIDKLERTNKQ